MLTPGIRILSLGAGVQSTTMALMAAHGEIEAPDAAIFADTGWEPKAVYEHLGWLCSGNVLPFPVHRVSHGNIRDDIVAASATEKGRFAAVPWFTSGGGMGRRQCTEEYKLYPIRDKAKALYFEKTGADPSRRIPPRSIECLIGISTDEAARIKPAKVKYMVNSWPLIDKRMSRWDCLLWMDRHGYPTPPKSSCIGCPYHNNAHWRKMRDETPTEFRDAVEVDKIIRDGGTRRGIRSRQFMHRSGKPLDEVDLSTAEDRGQLNMFNNECEGMCGV